MKQQGFFEDETNQRLQSMKQGNSAMLVVLRIRPLTSKQSLINQTQCLKPFDKKLVTLIDTEDGEKKRSKQTQFSFDFVFSKEVTTKKIYDQCLSGFLGGVLEGFYAAILAYGATGCGKTYTMIGDINNEGICALSLIDLLGRAQQLKATHHVALRLSYIEIYNEVIKDILVSEDKSLQLREDPKEGVQVIGATEVPIASFVQLATLLKVGTANRSKQSTSSNEASSRSHGLLLVKVQTRQKAQSTKEQVLIGKLSLVDLAGSEKATGGKNLRQLQGSKINKSLLVLGNCIQILSEGNGKHIPYRQSKLTRILKEALGGNCRTIMLACVSPFAGNREQNYNTLLYASRARNIGSNVTRNVQNSEAHLSSYIALISNLKKENEDLKRQLKSNKNYSLPQLKIPNSSHLEAERLSSKIDSHFAKQVTLIRAINQIALKIDKAAFKLLKCQYQKKKNAQKHQKKLKKQDKSQQNLNDLIQQLGEHKEGFQKRFQDLALKRGNLVEEIKDKEWLLNEVAALFTHYRQKKIEVELEEIKLREARLLSEKNEKDQLLTLISEEMKLRESIIQQQKIIIQKNNIINRITYSRLNNSHLLPKVSQRLQVPLQSSLFKQLSTQLSQSSLHNTKREQNMNNHLKEKSSKKIKREVQQKYISNYSIDKLQKIKEKSQSPRVKMNKKEGEVSKKKYQQFDLVYMQR